MSSTVCVKVLRGQQKHLFKRYNKATVEPQKVSVAGVVPRADCFCWKLSKFQLHKGLFNTDVKRWANPDLRRAWPSGRERLVPPALRLRQLDSRALQTPPVPFPARGEAPRLLRSPAQPGRTPRRGQARTASPGCVGQARARPGTRGLARPVPGLGPRSAGLAAREEHAGLAGGRRPARAGADATATSLLPLTGAGSREPPPPPRDAAARARPS